MSADYADFADVPACFLICADRRNLRIQRLSPRLQPPVSSLEPPVCSQKKPTTGTDSSGGLLGYLKRLSPQARLIPHTHLDTSTTAGLISNRKRAISRRNLARLIASAPTRATGNQHEPPRQQRAVEDGCLESTPLESTPSTSARGRSAMDCHPVKTVLPHSADLPLAMSAFAFIDGCIAK